MARVRVRVRFRVKARVRVKTRVTVRVCRGFLVCCRVRVFKGLPCQEQTKSAVNERLELHKRFNEKRVRLSGFISSTAMPLYR